MTASFVADSKFPTTNWSMVMSGRAALAQFILRYERAMISHLVQVKRVEADEARDVLQGFVCSQMLEKDLLATANRERGRFRAFLLTALDRFLVSQWRKQTALKRSPAAAVVSLSEHQSVAEPAAADAFELAWARQVLDETVSRMKSFCLETDQADVWRVFERRLLGPILNHEPAADFRTLRAEMGMLSPAQASNLLVTAKRTYIRTLRGVVSQYCQSDDEVDDEIADLIRILSQGGA